MIAGVHWEDVKRNTIDLDLSLINCHEGKIGWNASYRSTEKSVLFSGDITSAPKPKGASEFFYFKKQKPTSYLMLLNYFNFDESIPAPFKIIIASENTTHFGRDYAVNPNNVVSITKSEIAVKQKLIGLIVLEEDVCKFYFSETSLGNSIVSGGQEYVEQARKYLFSSYENSIDFVDLLKDAGAKVTHDKSKIEKCDFDLSPANIKRDTIVDLLT